jgi:hypothetical protein
MKLPLFLALIFCFPFVSHAQEPRAHDIKPDVSEKPVPVAGTRSSGAPIEGAFGFKLGDVFIPAPAQKPTVEKHLEVYQVQPKVPNPTFSVYELRVGAQSRRICSIRAIGETTVQAESLRQVQAFLNQKYGEFGSVATGFLKGNRGVDLSGLTPGENNRLRFHVTYYDLDLMKEAANEGADAAQKKLLEKFNPSGL